MNDVTPGRVLAIDPGEKRIGVALSDPGAALARPLQVIVHKSRDIDAQVLAEIARENEAVMIVIGAAYGPDGEETPASRKSARLADAIREHTQVSVILWDESGSTKGAKEFMIKIGTGKQKRKGHQDEIAAAIILQNYLDNKNSPKNPQA